MTVKYLIDEKGNKTAVQMSLEDYHTLLESANILPQHVIEGIRRTGRWKVGSNKIY